MKQRSDAGGEHAMTSAGRAACALAATDHGVYSLMESGLLPRCATCPDEVRALCAEASDDAPHCPILAGFRAGLLRDLARQMESAGGHIKPHEWPLVAEYAKTATLLLRVDQVLQAVGLERREVEDVGVKPSRPGEPYARKQVTLNVRPLLTLRSTLSGQLFRQAEIHNLPHRPPQPEQCITRRHTECQPIGAPQFFTVYE